MRYSRFPAATKAAGLALSILLAGSACGAGAAQASTQGAAVTGPVSREERVRQELRKLEASYEGRIGAYAVDTATGRTVGNRSGERFPLLSTFKALAAGAVLHKARTSDPGLMDRVIRWKAEEVVEYSPVTEKHVRDGMTVAALCEAAITRSDNTAGNMLLRQIGGPAGLTGYLRTLKDPVSRLDRWETDLNVWKPGAKRDTTTPVAAARDLRALTAGDALHAKDRARLNGWLRANQTGDARIRAGLPRTWIIGDKTGSTSYYGGANDIAVIWPGKSAAPIIMSIYTDRRAADAPYDEAVIAQTATILARGLGRLP
ncbi:beta-lactamase [Microtetraspora sp. NBRC 13810]|uniref:class A beta-lactamase n=1 Tax=Microtetraspora sp. NBRC 13810 TaxID=3030990 RepID=UPI0024A5B0A0|nr:class A beta-lactamase [Microtetraspora sp. NBRC 13810]GLW10070.1 beta-lactamase [Microtetraspora sp. NBRC 13810]